MQPYFFPYIGYWQLMNAVDKYVIYDDVNFIKGGWINRNRILMNGKPQYFNLPMIGASPNKLINEVQVNNDEKMVAKNVQTIYVAYHKAPYFNDVFPLIKRCLECGMPDVASYIKATFEIVSEYLGINTEFVVSSSLDKDCSLKGQDKVISICRLLGADEYYNAIGGQVLYSREAFNDFQIKLGFLKTNSIVYKQTEGEFQPNLSIIDVMMFNSVDDIRNMLNDCVII